MTLPPKWVCTFRSLWHNLLAHLLCSPAKTLFIPTNPCKCTFDWPQIRKSIFSGSWCIKATTTRTTTKVHFPTKLGTALSGGALNIFHHCHWPPPPTTTVSGRWLKERCQVLSGMRSTREFDFWWWWTFQSGAGRKRHLPPPWCQDDD